MTELTLSQNEAIQVSAVESALVNGDLSQLSDPERVSYYLQVCKSVGLNPLTKPFQYLKLNGKLTLYATKDAAAQVRKNHGISITDIQKDIDRDSGLVTITVKGRDLRGREDCEIGIVSIQGLKGDNLCNAILKAVTKSKRRLSLSLGGLGYLDETELETIPNAQPIPVELATASIAAEEPVEEIEREVQAYEATEDLADEDLIAVSDVEMTRVGWQATQGRAFLKANFGKQQRSELTAIQLRIFITHLRSLETTLEATKS